jgi:hypothetical protein
MTRPGPFGGTGGARQNSGVDKTRGGGAVMDREGLKGHTP